MAGQNRQRRRPRANTQMAAPAHMPNENGIRLDGWAVRDITFFFKDVNFVIFLFEYFHFLHVVSTFPLGFFSSSFWLLLLRIVL